MSSECWTVSLSLPVFRTWVSHCPSSPLPQCLWSRYTAAQLAALSLPPCDRPSADRCHRAAETAVLLRPRSGLSFIPARGSWLRATRHSCYVGGMSRAADSAAALELDLTLVATSDDITLSTKSRRMMQQTAFRGWKHQQNALRCTCVALYDLNLT